VVYLSHSASGSPREVMASNSERNWQEADEQLGEGGTQLGSGWREEEEGGVPGKRDFVGGLGNGRVMAA
jgi:hypothetical protein